MSLDELLPLPARERFRVLSRLGAGGMGVVYEAEDRERGEVVALKTVAAPGADAMYRMKQEFRALSELVHPNLVRLYDLVVDGERAFFTMERVEGVEFTSYCRTAPAVDPLAVTAHDVGRPTYDEQRLRRALGHLAVALHVLHRAGKVHRDVKPSNVLVTPEGRSVLLDFGLVNDVHTHEQWSVGGSVVGTAAYMSPEQARGESELSAATDWYAVGVVLYEVLTGMLPHHGPILQVLADKQRTLPRSPRELWPDAPADLDALTMELLRIDPSGRPRGEEILARLGVAAAAGSQTSSLGPRKEEDALVGRERELALLEEGMEGARPRVLVVHGASGMGKTTLAQSCLRRLTGGEALVLTSRCYPRESVPFKALDGIVDALSRHLRGLSDPDVARLLPEDAGALAQIFPVLRRVQAIAAEHARLGDRAAMQAADTRLRAFAALREVLARISIERRVVLFIDDLQWSDGDSATLLDELLRPPDAPTFTLLATARTIDATANPAFAALEALKAEGVPFMAVSVGPLGMSDACALAAKLCDASPDDPRVRAAAEAAEGSPLLLEELLRASLEAPIVREAGEATRVDRLILARAAALDASARRLLEIVSIAGGPIEIPVAQRAAGLPEEDRALLDRLRITHWLRGGRIGGHDAADTAHDRIREALATNLTDESREAHHRSLAEALERIETPPVERIARHLAASGDHERAKHYARRAAEHALGNLAFDKAVDLYSMLRDLAATEEERFTVMPELARALELDGRAAEAAEIRLALADRTEGAVRIEQRRCAAENLLRSGRHERALSLLTSVAGELGVHIPVRNLFAILGLLIRRARIAVRGLGFVERRADELPARDLGRLDALALVAQTLTNVDPLRGSVAQASLLLDALRLGEPSRVCKALAIETMHRASFGDHARADRISADAALLAERTGSPQARAYAEAGLGVNDYFSYRFDAARTHFAATMKILSELPVSSEYELTVVQLLDYFAAQYYGGKLRTGANNLEARIADAKRRNDLHGQAVFSAIPFTYLCLADDRPARALEMLEHALDGFPPGAFTMMHMYVGYARALLCMYQGNTAEAHERAVILHRASRRSGLQLLQLVRDDHHRLVASTALSVGDDALARTHFRPLLRSRHDAILGQGHMLRAAHLVRQGDTAGAQRDLLEAAERFGRARVLAWQATAHDRLARLSSGPASEQHAAVAAAWAREEQIARPDRVFALFCPWPEPRQLRP